MSASVQHFNHACSERLRCCISILVSARKGLSLLWCLTTQGSLVQRQFFFPPVIYRLPRRTSRGTPPTIYPVNTQPLAFCLFCTRKKNLCKCLAKQGTRQACTSPFTGNIDAAKFSSKKKMTSFFVCVSCLCLFLPPLPVFSFCSSPANALKRFRGTLLSKMCKLLLFFFFFFFFFFFHFSGVLLFVSR